MNGVLLQWHTFGWNHPDVRNSVFVAGIVGGIGLLKGKNWARVLVLFLAVLDLIDFPIGTAIGAYTFWVLLNNETSAMFDGAGGSKLVAQPACC